MSKTFTLTRAMTRDLVRREVLRGEGEFLHGQQLQRQATHARRSRYNPWAVLRNVGGYLGFPRRRR